ncbi:hypothetical protein ABZV31_06080 [Streptomyces sp. NPDC005202]|uniref:hypothetical protein n=1 Tax=Streptomyces sp. NPDC005202 TaxID=3157021 RepID=UPI0033ABDA61
MTGRAFAAFVRGKWKVESETTNGETGTYAVTVADGVWTLDWGGGGNTWGGTWATQGGRLALRVPESKSSPEELTDAAAENVPASVGDSVSLFLPWQPPGQADTSDGQRLDANYTSKGGAAHPALRRERQHDRAYLHAHVTAARPGLLRRGRRTGAGRLPGPAGAAFGAGPGRCDTM